MTPSFVVDPKLSMMTRVPVVDDFVRPWRRQIQPGSIDAGGGREASEPPLGNHAEEIEGNNTFDDIETQYRRNHVKCKHTKTGLDARTEDVLERFEK